MGHYDGKNYTSSITAFLDAGKNNDLEQENKELKKEIIELKRVLKLLVECIESKKYNDYTMRYAREEAKALIG